MFSPKLFFEHFWTSISSSQLKKYEDLKYTRYLFPFNQTKHD